MTQIMPQEFVLLNDNPVIRTKCPPELVTDDMVAKRARNGNLAAGDCIRVQCFDNLYQTLVAECEYRVTARTAALRTVEINDRETRQSEELTYRVERWTDWRRVGQAQGSDTVAGIGAPVVDRGHAFIDGDAYCKWNPGRRMHEVRRRADDSVICAHADKETAERIASGELPIPEAA